MSALMDNDDDDNGTLDDFEAQTMNHEKEPLSSTSASIGDPPLRSPRSVAEVDTIFARYCSSNPEFFKQALVLLGCLLGLKLSFFLYASIVATMISSRFTPTKHVPSGIFPSMSFCIFTNQLVAIVLAMFVIRIKRGAFFVNNISKASHLWVFAPYAVAKKLSSWSQYAALQHFSFSAFSAFNSSSKLIPVMLLGVAINGRSHSWSQYMEALLMTAGVAMFSYSGSSSSSPTVPSPETVWMMGLFFSTCYVLLDSFALQWQDYIYHKYNNNNNSGSSSSNNNNNNNGVDPFQMLLGVNVSAIVLTTVGLFLKGDFFLVGEFLHAHPVVLVYLLGASLASVGASLLSFFMIKQYGPIVYTMVMIVCGIMLRNGASALSTGISSAVAVAFGGGDPSSSSSTTATTTTTSITTFPTSVVGAVLVVAVIVVKIRRNYSYSSSVNNETIKII